MEIFNWLVMKWSENTWLICRMISIPGHDMRAETDRFFHYIFELDNFEDVNTIFGTVRYKDAVVLIRPH